MSSSVPKVVSGSPPGIEVYVLAVDEAGCEFQQRASISQYVERVAMIESERVKVFEMRATFVAQCKMTPTGWRYRLAQLGVTRDVGIASIEGRGPPFSAGDIVYSDCRIEIS